MDSSVYSFNIRGCLGACRDVLSARGWFVRAQLELPHDQFNNLIILIHGWLLQHSSYHDISEQVFQLLAEFDPEGDSTRRSLFKQEVNRLKEHQVHLENESRARQERERLETLKQEERNRQAEERRQALKRLETLKQEEMRQQEERRRQVEEMRSVMLRELHQRLQNDFVGADTFFQDSCTNIITAAEFEREKIAFVKSWIAENTSCSNDGQKRLPDDEQAAAIATVNGHVQVVARAGSGKTTTLVNRALFLLKHCDVPPANILLLAFNRKATIEIRRRLLCLLSEEADQAIAAEINDRTRSIGKSRNIKKDEIEADAVNAVALKLNIVLPHVMTFHALAYAVVHPEDNLLYNGAEGDAQALNRVVQQVIDDHLQIPAFKHQIRELMLAHFQEDWDKIVDGCYDKSRDELLRFRRSLPRESLRGDYVKSFGEKVIADFLFEHGIAYRYERNHWWRNVNYRPDFTLFQTPHSGIIIEYFGLEGDADYDEMSHAKRAYWAAKEAWTLLEFAPHDIASQGVDTFLVQLKRSLEEQGIACVRLSEEEIWYRIRDRAIDRFTSAMAGFIGRCRKLSLTPNNLSSLIAHHTSLSPVEDMFLRLAGHLYKAYLERLSATGDEDFDGLMQRAINEIETGNTIFERKSAKGDLAMLQYICIDEFQDFSELFYQLIHSIRIQNPNVELFCVGDDWQAINGFAGSNLKFFVNFKEYIGDSSRLYISTNYRSSKSIVSIGNALMAGLGKPANPNKTSSNLVLASDLNEFEPSLLEQQRHPGDIITPVVLRLASKALNDGMDVVLLCRRNAIPWFVNYPDHTGGGLHGLARYLEFIRSFFPKGLKERITISTAHKYKGLEKSMVIVLDAVARSYPLIHPDWAFSRILGDSPTTITEEERRLFYVALTRAVETLVIITDGRSKSPFLEELERRERPVSINWASYPPMRGSTARLVVKIGNQPHRGVTPTLAVKDLLKAADYRWQTVGWPGWAKSFSAENFQIDMIKSELWAESADGVEVRVFDDADVLMERYLIDAGHWKCIVNQQEKAVRITAEPS